MRKFVIPKPSKVATLPPKAPPAQWSKAEIAAATARAVPPLVFNKISDKQSNRTPDKVRQAASKLALLESGGKRLSVNLSGESIAHLDAIKVRDGLDNTGAIAAALGAFAPKKRP